MRSIENLKLVQWRQLFTRFKSSLMQSLNIFATREAFWFELQTWRIFEYWRIKSTVNWARPNTTLTDPSLNWPCPTHISPVLTAATRPRRPTPAPRGQGLILTRGQAKETTRTSLPPCAHAHHHPASPALAAPPIHCRPPPFKCIDTIQANPELHHLTLRLYWPVSRWTDGPHLSMSHRAVSFLPLWAYAIDRCHLSISGQAVKSSSTLRLCCNSRTRSLPPVTNRLRHRQSSSSAWVHQRHEPTPVSPCTVQHLKSLLFNY
jgi:hypothetical protein